MRKILFFILAGVSTASLADTSKIFPENPPDLKSCYEAGQAWIRARMWQMNPPKDLPAITFNSQLAACTWKTPEASNFKWPNDYEYRSKTPYHNILSLTPQGDWTVASFSETSDDSATYLRLSKKTSVTEQFYAGSLAGYFFGFDYAAYDLEKSNRAFGAQTAFLNKQGSSIYLNLAGIHEGKPRSFLQSIKETIAFDTQKKNWFSKKCLYQISPDPKNSLSAIVEKCHVNEAADLPSLQQGLFQARPDTTHTFRWDGVKYEEGAPTEWLAKRNAPPIKIPKLTEATSKSAIKENDGVRYQAVLLTKTPQGRKAPVSSIQWLEISAGVQPTNLKKINRALKALAFEDSDLMLEPEISDESAKPELRYGESASAVDVVSVTRDFLTVSVFNTSMAYGRRSYDSKGYVIYSLKSGEVVVPASAFFKSQKALDLFSYWATNFFKDKLTYKFPKQWTEHSGEGRTGFLTFIPRKEGIQVVVGGDMGGHYFEDFVGVVPYSVIPEDWMLSDAKGARSSDAPLLKPRLNCTAGLEQPDDKYICDLKLTSEYEAVLALWQARLEAQAGNADGEDNVSSDFMGLVGKFEQCGEDKGCVKKILEEDRARLRGASHVGH
jgi:hypothetical protein